MNADIGILDVASAQSGAPMPTFSVRNGRKGWVPAVREGRGFGKCLAELEALVFELEEEDVSGLSDEQLSSGAQVLAKPISRLDTVRGQVLIAADERCS